MENVDLREAVLEFADLCWAVLEFADLRGTTRDTRRLKIACNIDRY